MISVCQPPLLHDGSASWATAAENRKHLKRRRNNSDFNVNFDNDLLNILHVIHSNLK